MKRALLVKELRESAALVALAALGMAWCLATLRGWTASGRIPEYGLYYIPFVTDDFLLRFAIVDAVLAILLGLKQSAWEEMRGTYHYLLYRPTPRSVVIELKLASGLAVVMAVGAAMILLQALWAARAGNHASPFYWSMTAEAWRHWIVFPIVYLAAFLSGLRPARWFGTRLAPLVGGVAVAIGLAMQPWWWVAAAGSVLVSGVLTACILSVAESRDY